MPQHLFSMPKGSVSDPKHRKVTVTVNDDGSLLYDLKETLLSFGIQPKDMVSAFGNLKMTDYLMRLDKTWHVQQTLYNDFPDMYKDIDSPIAKLCHSLLTNDIRPLSLCSPKDTRFVAHLTELQDGWKEIKENHSPAEPACAFCGTAGALLRCSGCMAFRREVRYCNKECQTAGWRAHKKAGCGRYASKESKERLKHAYNAAKGLVSGA
jgi:hypothetical protein